MIFLTLLGIHALRLYPQVISELKAQGFSGAGLPGNCKDFVLSKNPGLSCQRADITTSSSPGAWSHSRWGRDSAAGADCPQGPAVPPHCSHAPLLPAHQPLRLRVHKDSEGSASQLAPSAPWTWSRAGFSSNCMGDHPRQKPRVSCPGMGQRACRECGLMVIPSTLHYYQN